MVQDKYVLKIKYLLAGAVFVLLSCGQSTRSIQHTYYVSKTVFPGIPPIKSSGTPNIYHPDTVKTIYLETKNGYVPTWVTAMQNGKLFDINTTAITEDSVQLGLSPDNKPVLITVGKKGNHLWQLRLTEKAPGANTDSVSLNAGKIIFYTADNQAKKTIVQIDKQVELMPERRP